MAEIFKFEPLIHRYFFTFGVGAVEDTGQPYQNGHVEVHAESRDKACEKFMAHFPCEMHTKPLAQGEIRTINCAFFYDETQWNVKDREKYPNMFKCWEVIK